MPRTHVLGWCALTALLAFGAGRLTVPSAAAPAAATVASSPTCPREPPSTIAACPTVAPSAPCPTVSPSAPPTTVASEGMAPPRPTAPPPKQVSRKSLLSAFRFAGFGPNGGLRLGRVTQGTLPDLLGLQSGDEIISLNGFRIAEPQQAILAYAKLPYTDDWVARVARGGTVTEIRYALR